MIKLDFQLSSGCQRKCSTTHDPCWRVGEVASNLVLGVVSSHRGSRRRVRGHRWVSDYFVFVRCRFNLILSLNLVIVRHPQPGLNLFNCDRSSSLLQKCVKYAGRPHHRQKQPSETDVGRDRGRHYCHSHRRGHTRQQVGSKNLTSETALEESVATLRCFWWKSLCKWFR